MSEATVWSHVIRRRSNDYPDGAFSNAFAARLDAKYRARMTGEELFQNGLYLTLVWSPSLDVPDNLGTLPNRWQLLSDLSRTVVAVRFPDAAKFTQMAITIQALSDAGRGGSPLFPSHQARRWDPDG